MADRKGRTRAAKKIAQKKMRDTIMREEEVEFNPIYEDEVSRFNRFHLMEFLLDTENLTLIEGTTSSFWAGGEHYHSNAYDNQDVHGKNNQGCLVMYTRRNEHARRQKTNP